MPGYPPLLLSKEGQMMAHKRSTSGEGLRSRKKEEDLLPSFFEKSVLYRLAEIYIEKKRISEFLSSARRGRRVAQSVEG